MIVETLLSIGNTLFTLRSALSKARKERKQAVADFIASIAESIEGASTELKQRQYPHGKCQELFAHSEHMEAAIGDLVGKPDAQALGARLKQVWQIENLFGELQGMPDDERLRKLAALDQAAGTFRATAAFVRASP